MATQTNLDANFRCVTIAKSRKSRKFCKIVRISYCGITHNLLLATVAREKMQLPLSGVKQKMTIFQRSKSSNRDVPGTHAIRQHAPLVYSLQHKTLSSATDLRQRTITLQTPSQQVYKHQSIVNVLLGPKVAPPISNLRFIGAAQITPIQNKVWSNDSFLDPLCFVLQWTDAALPTLDLARALHC